MRFLLFAFVSIRRHFYFSMMRSLLLRSGQFNVRSLGAHSPNDLSNNYTIDSIEFVQHNNWQWLDKRHFCSERRSDASDVSISMQICMRSVLWLYLVQVQVYIRIWVHFHGMSRLHFRSYNFQVIHVDVSVFFASLSSIISLSHLSNSVNWKRLIKFVLWKRLMRCILGNWVTPKRNYY